MKLRVVTLYGADELINSNDGIKFLLDLPDECGLPGLALLNLATGELPPVLVLTLASLSGKILAVLLYDCCNDFDMLHKYYLNSATL